MATITKQQILQNSDFLKTVNTITKGTLDIKVHLT